MEAGISGTISPRAKEYGRCLTTKMWRYVLMMSEVVTLLPVLIDPASA